MSDPRPHALARPELAAVVDELARRFGAGAPPATIAVRDLAVHQRHALADLLGEARLPPATTRVRVARLQAALGLADVDELRAALEDLRGPIVDRRADHAAHRATRQALWLEFEADAAQVPLFTTGVPAVWLERLRRVGIRNGLERHRNRLNGALAVLRRLPADGVPLASLAHDALGDPHGLDPGRGVAAIVLDAIAAALDRNPPVDAEGTRELWETVGVAPDLLSSAVLTLGLSSPPTHPLAGYLDASARIAEPVMLTLAQLRRWPLPPLPAHRAVYVFENPSVLAEAARRNWSGPVLVCSSGRPTVAVLTLLRQLGSQGALIHQHADFDPTGLSITAWLAERARTVPWHMSAAAYTDALTTTRRRRALRGVVPETGWDPPLCTLVTSAGVAVFEEELCSTLLDAIDPAS